MLSIQHTKPKCVLLSKAMSTNTVLFSLNLMGQTHITLPLSERYFSSVKYSSEYHSRVSTKKQCSGRVVAACKEDRIEYNEVARTLNVRTLTAEAFNPCPTNKNTSEIILDLLVAQYCSIDKLKRGRKCACFPLLVLIRRH